VDHGILFTLRLFGAAPDLGSDDLAVLALALTEGSVEEYGFPVVDTEVPTTDYADKIHESNPLPIG
jgi:hypothetical protein